MAERRDLTPLPEEGPALDLGDLDWTIPPDSQPGTSPGSSGPSLGWVARRIRTAMLHAGASLAATGVTLAWWGASGMLPTTDPTIGVVALLLHIGAFVTAWLALRASIDAWQALYLRPGQTPPFANMTQVISLVSAAVMCFHAAMVLSSLLA
jgi:hypothetical protein